MNNSYISDISLKLSLLPFIILALLCIGILVLQFFLSTRKEKFAGLIFPGIFAIISIIVVSNNTAFTSVIQTGLNAIFLTLLCNIPTAVMLVIYFICRRKYINKTGHETNNT